MDRIYLLVIRSNNISTQGMPRYIPKQLEHLPERIQAVSIIKFLLTPVVLTLSGKLSSILDSPDDAVHMAKITKNSLKKPVKYYHGTIGRLSQIF